MKKKKKIELNKKTIKWMQLKLEEKNDRKVAPALLVDEALYEDLRPSRGQNCTG